MAGRHSAAVGAYRAALAIDASEIEAHVGLARALGRRGDREQAVDGLVETAQAMSERNEDRDALRLYGEALAIDPSRHELHLDVAVIEWHQGRHDAAHRRAESLADMYMTMGRTEEAVELLRFFADLDKDPTPPPTTETVVCATVLIRPDGSLFVSSQPKPKPKPRPKLTRISKPAPVTLDLTEEVLEADMITQVRRARPRAAATNQPTKRAAPRPIRKPAPPRHPKPAAAKPKGRSELAAKLLASTAAKPRAAAPNQPRPAVAAPARKPKVSATPRVRAAAPKPERPHPPTRTPRVGVPARAPKAKTVPITKSIAPPRKPATPPAAARPVQGHSPLAQRLLKRAGTRRPPPPKPAPVQSTPIPPLGEDEITRCFRRPTAPIELRA